MWRSLAYGSDQPNIQRVTRPQHEFFPRVQQVNEQLLNQNFNFMVAHLKTFSLQLRVARSRYTLVSPTQNAWKDMHYFYYFNRHHQTLFDQERTRLTAGQEGSYARGVIKNNKSGICTWLWTEYYLSYRFTHNEASGSQEEVEGHNALFQSLFHLICYEKIMTRK